MTEMDQLNVKLPKELKDCYRRTGVNMNRDIVEHIRNVCQDYDNVEQAEKTEAIYMAKAHEAKKRAEKLRIRRKKAEEAHGSYMERIKEVEDICLKQFGRIGKVSEETLRSKAQEYDVKVADVKGELYKTEGMEFFTPAQSPEDVFKR